MTRIAKAGQPTKIADLRAGVFAAKQAAKAPKPAKVPKPPKRMNAAERETEDDRAAKAEKFAQIQHSTSLLGVGKKPSRPRGQLPEREKGGFVLQLLLVSVVSGGVAMALDPSIVPVDWREIGDTIKGWL